MRSFTFGILGEYYTAWYYRLKFYQIIAKRYKNYCGEIDIIASKGKNLVFIEVKSRSNSYGEKIIRSNQQRRISRSAQLFIADNPKYQSYNMRFDFVLVRPFKLPEIIPNAW